MRLNRDEVIDYINNLKGFRGYVQFSNRPLDLAKDIFTDNDPKVDNEIGFIYEAHFANENEYITIKQSNNSWAVDRGSLKNIEIQKFYGIAGNKVKMEQIWQEESDELCEDMLVKKLKKVVFAGFAQGDEK